MYSPTGSLRDLFITELGNAVAAKDTKVAEVANRVSLNELKVSGHTLFTVAATGGSTTTQLCEQSKAKTRGINNFAHAKPAPNQLLLCMDVRVTGVVLGAVPTDATMAAANYGSIKGIAAMQNGEIDIYSNGQIIVKDFPLSNFVTDQDQTGRLGTYKLPVPKFIYPDSEIKIEIRTGVAHDVNTVIKVELAGVATMN